jgi:aminoglycoside N3'-acetyltransferase
VVSDHPEGRFAAAGSLAEELLRDVPWDDYYGPGSPLERLVQAGGRVLRLGADPDTVTLLHHAEYLCDLPGKRRVRRHRVVRGPEGPEVRVVECLDDEHGIVDHGGGDEFAAILTDYLATGRACTGRVGGATAELIDAADLLAFGTEWLTEHLGAVARGAQPWW